jgi:multidrug resistance protein, MATE family
MEIHKKDIKQTINLATPIIIGQLGHMMMGVVDSVMVGKIGAAPLAAASISNGIFIIILILGYGISMAISPLVAKHYGAKEYEKCGVVLRQGLIVNIITSFILFAALFFVADIIAYLNQPEEIIDQAIKYTKTLGWSMIPVMLFQTYRQYAEGLSIMRPAMVVTLSANIINIFANWVFIFGNLGIPAFGLVGAGIATFCSRVFMASALIWFVSSAKRFKPFDPTLHFKKIDWSIMKKILQIGLPSGFQYFFEVSAFAGSSIIIGWIGTNALAAHHIALNMASITYMFALGVSAAATVRVGNAVGLKNREKIRNAGFSAILMGATVMGFFGVMFIIFRNIFPTFYIADINVIEIAASLLIIAAFFQIFDGTQAVGLGILRGIADVKAPTVITFLAYWVVGLPVGYVLGFNFDMGVQGVWIGLSIALAVSAFLLSFRFNFRSKYVILG